MQNILYLEVIEYLTTMTFIGISKVHWKHMNHESQCDQVLETKQVNVSYLEQVRIKKHSLCLKIPPVCADWVKTMVTRWKLENVTRTVDKQMCCPGYQQASDAGKE